MRTQLLIVGVFVFVLTAAAQEERTIPLDKTYGTSGQKGIQRMTASMDGAGKFTEPYGEELAKLQQGVNKLRGKTAVALVAAKDVTEAVVMARAAIGGKVDDQKVGR